jgi:hypothetical protein
MAYQKPVKETRVLLVRVLATPRRWRGRHRVAKANLAVRRGIVANWIEDCLKDRGIR